MPAGLTLHAWNKRPPVLLLIGMLDLLEALSVPVSPDEPVDELNVLRTGARHGLLEHLRVSPDALSIALAALDGVEESLLEMAREVLLDLLCERGALARFELRTQRVQVGRGSAENYGRNQHLVRES